MLKMLSGKYSVLLCLLVLAALTVSSDAFGASVRWKAGWADDNWFNTSNWDLGYVPTAADYAMINRAVVAKLYGGDAVAGRVYMGGSGGSMTIEDGDTLNASVFVSVGEDPNNNAIFTVNGGEVNIGTTSNWGYLKISRADNTTCIGHVEIVSGEINCDRLVFDELGTTTGTGSSLNIQEDGLLTVRGNQVSTVTALATDGRLTGSGMLKITYDSTARDGLGETAIAIADESTPFDYRWKASFANTDWFDSNNWDANGITAKQPPKAIDRAFIEQAVTASVVNGDAFARLLYMGGNTGSMIVGDGGNLNVTIFISVGEYANNNATFTVDGGEVNIGDESNWGYLKISKTDDTTCVGHVEIVSGAINCDYLVFDELGATTGTGSTLNIQKGGLLTVYGNQVSTITALAADGRLTGSGMLKISYDSTARDGLGETSITVADANTAFDFRWKASFADANWFNLNNWDANGITPQCSPRAIDRVFVERAVTASVVNGNAFAKQLYMGGNGGSMIIGDGGNLNATTSISVGEYADNNSTFTVDGGTIETSRFKVSRTDDTTCIGHVELTSGKILCDYLELDEKGTTTGTGATVNITNGLLGVNTARSSVVNGYISDGRIKGFGYTGRVGTQISDGKIWVYGMYPSQAYNPTPSDNNAWLDPTNIVLQWGAGVGAASHKIYFGSDILIADIDKSNFVDWDDLFIVLDGWLIDDFGVGRVNSADLNNDQHIDLQDFAIIAENWQCQLNPVSTQITTSYSPGTLEYGKTYYWRVDEISSGQTEPNAQQIGRVWSFSTAYNSQCIGTPVVWTAPQPDPCLGTTAGLTLVDSATTEIYHGTLIANGGLGSFVQVPTITHYNGKYIVGFANHDYRENGPGQRILYSTSTDGITWSAASILINSLSWPMASTTTDGLVVMDVVFESINGRLYAISNAQQSIWSNSLDKQTWGWKEQMARCIDSNGLASGNAFWLTNTRPEGTDANIPLLSDIQSSQPIVYSDITAITERVDEQTAKYEPWPYGAEGNYLYEVSVFTKPNGMEVALLRDADQSRKIWACERVAGSIGWTRYGVVTNIFDAPSLNRAGQLPDGRFFILGNHINHPGSDYPDWDRDPLTFAISEDGVMFDRAWAIRAGASGCRVYDGTKVKGFQYPDYIIVGNEFWTVYVVNKEDVAITRVPLTQFE